MSKEQFIVHKDDDGIRLDKWMKRHRPDIPHGLLQKLLRKGAIRLDGKKAETSTRLKKGQQVTLPPVAVKENTQPYTKKPSATLADAEKYLLKNILYKDADIIVLNKPAGLAAQGGSKVKISVDAMLDYLMFDAKERPKLVHRIDKDTSGILVLARTRKAAAELGELFKTREVEKTYWAVVVGVPHPPRGTINLPLVAKKQEGTNEKAAVDKKEGKKAITHYEILDHATKTAAWLAVYPETGRMHQIRVHMEAVGWPILGDGKYGGKAAFIHGLPQQMHLHARAITLPAGKGKTITFSAPLPPHMKTTFKALGFNEKEMG